MEFENLHQRVDWLTEKLEGHSSSNDRVAALEARVATLETRLAAADGLARAAMAEIKEHESETNTMSQPETPAMEAPHGQIDNQGTSSLAG